MSRSTVSSQLPFTPVAKEHNWRICANIHADHWFSSFLMLFADKSLIFLLLRRFIVFSGDSAAMVLCTFWGGMYAVFPILHEVFAIIFHRFRNLKFLYRFCRFRQQLERFPVCRAAGAAGEYVPGISGCGSAGLEYGSCCMDTSPVTAGYRCCSCWSDELYPNGWYCLCRNDECVRKS